MKLSQVSLSEVKDFCGISDDDSDTLIQDIIMPAAASFIREYTGLTAEQADALEDLTLPYLVMIDEMYTSRDYAVTKDKLNPYVKTVLDMHSVNYL
ncbi:MAG: phage gp6-like head-tail connector protein [Ruminococcus sp.]|nr:phage gp6-like head-tail connector protein [Ruminococcus sp.]